LSSDEHKVLKLVQVNFI